MSTDTTHAPDTRTAAEIASRLDIESTAAGFYRAVVHLDRAATKELDQAGLDPRLRELVRIRASQLNGCAYCIDMHTRAARKAGESEQRLYALAAWRESPLFTPRERAALQLTDAVTKIADDGVPDTVYQHAADVFSMGELANLILAITAINAWNRIAVSSGMVYTEPS